MRLLLSASPREIPPKNRPIRNVITYQRRSPKMSPRSAANTPIWQVNDEAIRTSVTGTAWYRFSSVGGGGQFPPA